MRPPALTRPSEWGCGGGRERWGICLRPRLARSTCIPDLPSACMCPQATSFTPPDPPCLLQARNCAAQGPPFTEESVKPVVCQDPRRDCPPNTLPRPASFAELPFR